MTSELKSPGEEEDEVFFGEITDKEMNKIKKFYKRRTALFLPGFRKNKNLMHLSTELAPEGSVKTDEGSQQKSSPVLAPSDSTDKHVLPGADNSPLVTHRSSSVDSGIDCSQLTPPVRKKQNSAVLTESPLVRADRQTTSHDSVETDRCNSLNKEEKIVPPLAFFDSDEGDIVSSSFSVKNSSTILSDSCNKTSTKNVTVITVHHTHSNNHETSDSGCGKLLEHVESAKTEKVEIVNLSKTNNILEKKETCFGATPVKSAHVHPPYLFESPIQLVSPIPVYSHTHQKSRTSSTSRLVQSSRLLKHSTSSAFGSYKNQLFQANHTEGHSADTFDKNHSSSRDIDDDRQGLDSTALNHESLCVKTSDEISDLSSDSTCSKNSSVSMDDNVNICSKHYVNNLNQPNSTWGNKLVKSSRVTVLENNSIENQAKTAEEDHLMSTQQLADIHTKVRNMLELNQARIAKMEERWKSSGVEKDLVLDSSRSDTSEDVNTGMDGNSLSYPAVLQSTKHLPTHKKTAFWVEKHMACSDDSVAGENDIDPNYPKDRYMKKGNMSETELCKQILDMYVSDDVDTSPPSGGDNSSESSDSSLDDFPLDDGEEDGDLSSAWVGNDENEVPAGSVLGKRVFPRSVSPQTLIPNVGEYTHATFAAYNTSEAKTRKLKPDNNITSAQQIDPMFTELIRKKAALEDVRRQKSVLKERIQNPAAVPDFVKAGCFEKKLSVDSLCLERYPKPDLLTDQDLDVLTKLHTACNSQRRAKYLTPYDSPMIIKHFPPPKEASRISWCENLIEPEVETCHKPRHTPTKPKPILQSIGQEFPYTEDVPSPVVITKVRKSKSLSRRYRNWPF